MKKLLVACLMVGVTTSAIAQDKKAPRRHQPNDLIVEYGKPDKSGVDHDQNPNLFDISRLDRRSYLRYT